jgi:hypothetical protein
MIIDRKMIGSNGQSRFWQLALAKDLIFGNNGSLHTAVIHYTYFGRTEVPWTLEHEGQQHVLLLTRYQANFHTSAAETTLMLTYPQAVYWPVNEQSRFQYLAIVNDIMTKGGKESLIPTRAFIEQIPGFLSKP